MHNTKLLCAALHQATVHCTALMHDTKLHNTSLSMLYLFQRTAHCTLSLHATNCKLLKLHTAKKALHTFDAIQQWKRPHSPDEMTCPRCRRTLPEVQYLELRLRTQSALSILAFIFSALTAQNSTSRHSLSQHLIPYPDERYFFLSEREVKI